MTMHLRVVTVNISALELNGQELNNNPSEGQLVVSGSERWKITALPQLTVRKFNSVFYEH